VAGGVPADREVHDRGLEVLAHRAAAGPTAALELLAELVDEIGLARAGVRQALVDESAVDDVTQDTLVSMAVSIRSFTGQAGFVTWLFTIAHRRAIDHLRRQRATEPLADGDVGDALRISSLISTREAVQQLVRSMAERYRPAIELRDIERLSSCRQRARCSSICGTATTCRSGGARTSGPTIPSSARSTSTSRPCSSPSATSALCSAPRRRARPRTRPSGCSGWSAPRT
jgi:RNA polymerase sigma-70 factor (ECF subfamily)